MVAVCPKILSAGHCDDDSCRFRHDVLICKPCRRICPDQRALDAHLISKKHLAATSSIPAICYCNVCDRTMGRISWDPHVRGSRHLKEAKRRGISPNVQPEVPEEVAGYTFCPPCNSHIPHKAWNAHIAGRKHRARTQYTKFTSALEEAEEDKHGVTVEGNLDFDVVDPSTASTGVSKKVTINTTVPHARLSVFVRLASSKHRSAFSPFVVTPLGTSQVKYRQSVVLTISGAQKFPGRADDRLELVFEDQQLNTQFIICRPIHITVGDSAAHKALQPKAPYVPKIRTARHPETKVVEGEKPPALGAVPYVVKLPKFDIPKNLLTTLATGSVPETVRRLREIFLPPTIEGASYGRHFRHLIWVEEYKSSRDLEYYDIPNSTLTRNRRYYHLEVPGLAEKRPSVLVGDNIFVRKSDAPEGHWYSGCVHFVHQKEVGLCFNYSFKTTSTDRFLVRFKLNRYPLRRQHQALETAFAPPRLLLPTEQHVLAPSRASLWSAFNKLIDTNTRQRQAVDCILRQPGGSVPFIIFGPPGTGKTITTVEAIRQIHAANPRARILACAPSNSAADLVASRLSMLGSDALFRFYAPSRPKQAVPHELEPFTYVNEDGNFSVPILPRVRQFRVIVSTCVSASVFFGIGVPRGHFTHIFIDEAGQATEPEAMLAVKTMADNTTNVILSGDPKQLGPIIRSPVARDLGLEISYIERLMKMNVYDEEDHDGDHPVVKLTQNFRSHPAILKFPDERFYKGELQPCGDPKVITSFIGSKHLEVKIFPIVFHAMTGEDAREASSPSFFNVDEVLDVKKTVEELRSDWKMQLTDDDIDVIAPYHAQVLKIRNVLRGRYDGIKVGSVEEFQGQERKVIIISTVRSSREFVEFDLRHTLGFVASPRRFNVAITRAKALVVIVGDPTVLSLDPLWRSFLNYVYKHGGWRGLPISWDPDADVDESGGYDRAIREAAERDMNEFTRKLEAMTLAGVGEDEDVVDRPWTRHDG